MNKKTNTWLFILGATVFNILTTVISAIILGLLCFRVLGNFVAITEENGMWFLMGIFVGAIALSFVLYRVILKRLLKRYDVEKYFDPIFGRRMPPKKINRE
ncbi:hypothetical protein AGMMS50255_2360 [Spirochaetia bacterium]|nr:hypothetical protein AGMMS50255_2360 [Spirochaetia bacterium]